MSLLEIFLAFKKLNFSVSASVLFLEWFTFTKKFDKYITEMSKQELNSCLKQFYTSARQKDGSYYKKTTMKSIRAAIDRFLRKTSNKGFSIIGDPTFAEANAVLDAFVKDLRKSGKIAGVVHKKPISKEQIQLLFRTGELGPANSVDPAQLFRTVWFYLSFYFGKRGRENQRQLKPNMLILRSTPDGKEFFELNREVAGSVLATKNHQGGLGDTEDESDGKIFGIRDSSICPVETIKNYLNHLNPACESLFQRPKDSKSNKFDVNNVVWYSNMPVGEATLGNLLRVMTKRAGIEPPLTNHSIRATSITVLANAHVETRLIKSVTGHKSDTSIESYSSRPSARQQEIMSSILSSYISPNDSAIPAIVNQTNQDKENQISTQEDSSSADVPLVSFGQLDAQSTTVVNNQSITFDKRNSSTTKSPVFNFHQCNVNIYN